MFDACEIGLAIKNGINRLDLAGRDVTQQLQVHHQFICVYSSKIVVFVRGIVVIATRWAYFYYYQRIRNSAAN